MTTGPDAHSIAALLPARPASRDAGRGRRAAQPADPRGRARLAPPARPGDHAAARRLRLRPGRAGGWRRQELKRLLHGTPAQQDLLGLLTAARGGLSGPDLAELTGVPCGRSRTSCTPCPGGPSPAGSADGSPQPAPRCTCWGTRNSRSAPCRYLGEQRLTGYRDRLHTWADTYRDQGWPAGTPEYLLRGYYRMLQAPVDLPRLIQPALPTPPATTACST